MGVRSRFCKKPLGAPGKICDARNVWPFKICRFVQKLCTLLCILCFRTASRLGGFPLPLRRLAFPLSGILDFGPAHHGRGPAPLHVLRLSRMGRTPSWPPRSRSGAGFGFRHPRSWWMAAGLARWAFHGVACEGRWLASRGSCGC